MLVGTRDMFAADSGAVTTTLPREEIEAALTSEPPADLILEILRAAPGNHDPENRTVNVGWARSDLESLLRDPDAEATRSPLIRQSSSELSTSRTWRGTAFARQPWS